MVSTDVRTLKKTWHNEWIYFACLVVLIVAMPSQWERAGFVLFLLIPVVFSLKYFDLEINQLKKSLFFFCIFVAASLLSLWVHIWQLTWELDNPNGLFGWQLEINGLLYAIPFNDGMWLRQLATPFLDHIFVTIYVHGFVACIVVLVVYFILSGQPNKILHAMFASFFLQYLFILPFHFWVDGHQVWWIQNQWEGTQFLDPIRGYRTFIEPLVPSLNHVFPSMHTSIAFICILIALREVSSPIKYFFVTLNVGIIISTVYLGIHWVVDVFGGLLFGYLILKLADKIMASKRMKEWLHRVDQRFNLEGDGSQKGVSDA